MYVSKIYRKKVKHLKESSYLKTKAATKVAVAVLPVQILVHPCFFSKSSHIVEKKRVFPSQQMGVYIRDTFHPSSESILGLSCVRNFTTL